MKRKSVELSPDVLYKIWSHWEAKDLDEDSILRRIIPQKPKSHEVNQNISFPHNQTAEMRSLESPLMPPSDFANFQLSGRTRWVDDVRTAFSNLGGEADLSEIYPEVAQIRRAGNRSVVKTLDATIRQTIEAHSSDSSNFREGNEEYFKWVRRGRWKLK